MARLRSWASAPQARLAHPREEHLLPLMVCARRRGFPGTLGYPGSMMGARLSSFPFCGVTGQRSGRTTSTTRAGCPLPDHFQKKAQAQHVLSERAVRFVSRPTSRLTRRDTRG